MAHEAQLIALANLRAQIITETLALSFSKPKEGSAGHDKLLGKIAGWEHILDGVRRSLKSRSNLNRVVHQANRFGPGSYAAAQSYKSRERNVATIAAATTEVGLALAELVQTLYAPPSLEKQALEVLKRTLKNMAESGDAELPVLRAEDTQTLVQQLQPGDGGGAGGGGLNPPGAMDTITLCILMIAMIRSWVAKQRNT